MVGQRYAPLWRPFGDIVHDQSMNSLKDKFLCLTPLTLGIYCLIQGGALDEQRKSAGATRGSRAVSLVARLWVLRMARTTGAVAAAGSVFTSGIVSTVQGQKIALYFTGRQHAGENIADVLKQRSK